MTRYFGTDGVRGVANKELTCDMAFTLGQAAVALLGPRLVIGRDTRKSGPMLEGALVAGITSAGGDALLAGIIPTPAIALLVRRLGASGGIVISASHNPPEYNGIKFFDAQGFKLSRETEDAFEARLQAIAQINGDKNGPLSGRLSPASPVSGPSIGAVIPLEDAAALYVAHATDIVRAQGFDLAGLHIVVDCGYGASFATTPEALRQLGAKVTAINTDFDGNNINVNCGSTNLEQLKACVIETGAALGIAHDGDADRVLAIDEAGNEIDGDFIEAICALDLKRQGRLTHNTVVSTVLCNLGFVTAMRENGIEVIQTAVGDSNVLAAMREGGFALGGEQSGHIIHLEYNSTGDGLVSALCLLVALKRSGLPLGRLAQVMTRYPQILTNIKVVDKAAFTSSSVITEAIRQAQKRLGEQGRVLVRPSGTEPLIRVMVEALDEQQARNEAQLLADLIKQELPIPTQPTTPTTLTQPTVP